MSETKRNHVGQWIDNSARYHLIAELKLARRCAAAYKTEPYHSAALLLADAHGRCAEVWREILARPEPAPSAHPLADKMMANAGPMGGQPEGAPLTDAQLACDDCGATGQALYEKSDHHGGTKRVCVDRDACHTRRPG